MRSADANFQELFQRQIFRIFPLTVIGILRLSCLHSVVRGCNCRRWRKSRNSLRRPTNEITDSNWFSTSSPLGAAITCVHFLAKDDNEIADKIHFWFAKDFLVFFFSSSISFELKTERECAATKMPKYFYDVRSFRSAEYQLKRRLSFDLHWIRAQKKVRRMNARAFFLLGKKYWSVIIKINAAVDFAAEEFRWI